MELHTVESDILNFLIKNILAENVSITASVPLRDIGIDSFSIVEIILFIERKYGLIIPDEYLIPDHFQTVNHIAKLVIQLSV